MENIKILREKTGAGIGDCQAALTEAGGDIDKAVEILGKKALPRRPNEAIAKRAKASLNWR